jgi:hypothetical protein
VVRDRARREGRAASLVSRARQAEVYYGRYRGGLQMEHGVVLKALSLTLNQVT